MADAGNSADILLIKKNVALKEADSRKPDKVTNKGSESYGKLRNVLALSFIFYLTSRIVLHHIKRVFFSELVFFSYQHCHHDKVR